MANELIDMMQDDDNYKGIDNLLLSLCDRSKILLFREFTKIQDNEELIYNLGYLNLNNIKKFSPIEQIFYTAYCIYFSNVFKDNGIEINSIKMRNIMLEEIEPQKTIKYQDKIYIADFEISFYHLGLNLKYVIELDGYDYHSNKNQMEHDYERENNLQKLGYKVIRFTGSQVYNKPYDCVDSIVNIITNDIKEITK